MTAELPPLVSPGWLAAELGAPDLVVLDASFYLPTEGRDAHALFRRAHLPGARFFDIDLFADPDTDLPHMVPSPGRFECLAGALGLGTADRLVFYDQRGLFSAARGWWLFGLFGHDRAAVLDGGLPLWTERGLPLQSGPQAAAPRRRFQARLNAARLRGLGDMIANLATGREQVLDARAAARFHAQVPEPRPGLPGGHIPGALSLPFTELLTDGRTLLPPEALRARFAEAGVDGTRPVVTSCGTGITAAVLSLALRVAGLEPGALYDGAWTEWASHPDLPRET